jgi:heme/copper-type cytochrome/quinol oxidase subunit 1
LPDDACDWHATPRATSGHAGRRQSRAARRAIDFLVVEARPHSEHIVHTLVRRYIKTAIGFLLFGLLIGGWMIVRRELWAIYPTPYEVSAHTHVILVGFVMTMILGVALWLFPRPDKSDQRYRPALAEAAYWMLTLGTAARALAELARSARPHERWLAWVIVAASMAQIAALALFFHTMWSRIRGLGSQARERQGERF